MHERECDLAAAVGWISDMHDNRAERFLSTLREVPSFGDSEIDDQVSAYIDGLGNWVRANDSWSFEVSHMGYDSHCDFLTKPASRARDTSGRKD